MFPSLEKPVSAGRGEGSNVPEQIFIEPRTGLPIVALRWDAAETVVDIFHAGTKVTRLQGLTALHTSGLRGEVANGQELFVRADRSVAHTSFEAALNGYPLDAQPINLYVSAVVEPEALAPVVAISRKDRAAEVERSRLASRTVVVGASGKTLDEQTTVPFLIALIPLLGALALLPAGAVRKLARQHNLHEPALNKAATVIASVQIVAIIAIVGFVIFGVVTFASDGGTRAIPA
jgi:hypothetical protein